MRGTFHRFNDFEERSFVAVHAETEAAAIATLRSDEASMHQALHDFGKKAAANTGGVSRTMSWALEPQGQGKVNHDADSIVGRAIDLHSPKMDLSRPVVGTMNTQMRLGRSIKGRFAL